MIILFIVLLPYIILGLVVLLDFLGCVLDEILSVFHCFFLFLFLIASLSGHLELFVLCQYIYITLTLFTYFYCSKFEGAVSAEKGLLVLILLLGFNTVLSLPRLMLTRFSLINIDRLIRIVLSIEILCIVVLGIIGYEVGPLVLLAITRVITFIIRFFKELFNILDGLLEEHVILDIPLNRVTNHFIKYAGESSHNSGLNIPLLALGVKAAIRHIGILSRTLYSISVSITVIKIIGTAV